MADVVGLSFIFGILGNIISVLLFLSPIKTFIQIVSKGSTGEFESIPYICTFLATSLWTYYGLIKPGALLVATVNGFGAVVELVFVTLFLIFAPPEMRAKTAKLAVILDLGFLGAVMLVSKYMLLDDEMRINMIGTLGAFVNILMYGSPLAALRAVMETRSVEYMPFLLSLCSFLNGGVWTIYAVLVKDLFLLVPNAVGFILGTIQLVVYARYSNLNNDQQYNEPLI
uniref:Bidirectional sugar transporter SWEET n=2 Tax=Chenopodium quinoa TaxID=63459 RepID=A0A803KNY7_CHEQI